MIGALDELLRLWSMGGVSRGCSHGRISLLHVVPDERVRSGLKKKLCAAGMDVFDMKGEPFDSWDARQELHAAMEQHSRCVANVDSASLSARASVWERTEDDDRMNSRRGLVTLLPCFSHLFTRADVRRHDVVACVAAGDVGDLLMGESARHDDASVTLASGPVFCRSARLASIGSPLAPLWRTRCCLLYGCMYACAVRRSREHHRGGLRHDG
jgi:hypothetical protein